MLRIQAPFTPEQVENLNAYQKAGHFHPFTCGSAKRCVEKVTHHSHKGDIQWEVSTTLIATKAGWKCPNCDYTQNWAWEFMTQPPTPPPTTT